MSADYDFTLPEPKRYPPYLELTFLFLVLAATAVAVFAHLGPRGDKITETAAALIGCATIWVVLRRDLCHWVNSRLQPNVATLVLTPIAAVVLLAATYTIATHQTAATPVPPVQTVAAPAPSKFV